MSVDPAFISIQASPVLSSEVGDVLFATDQEYAEISVCRGSDASEIYHERLYPNADGICTAYQIGDVLTQWMQDNNVTCELFTFSDGVTDVLHVVTVLLCSRIVDGGFGESIKHPLLSCRTAMIPPDGSINTYWSNSIDSRKYVTVDVVGLSDGESKSLKFDLPVDSEGKVLSKSISPESLLDMINGEDEGNVLDSISMIVLSCGLPAVPSLTVKAYISDDQDLKGFKFRNCFGLWEEIWMHAEALPDISIDVEMAVIGHRTVQYDIEKSMSMKVEAINFHQSEWPRVSQFLTSYDIVEISTGQRIFLSDISQDPPKTYDYLGSVKFSFSYEDDRLLN